MWWPFTYLLIYVVGGLTFVPVVVIAIILWVIQYGSTPIGDADPYKLKKALLQDEAERDEQLEKEKQKEKDRASGGNAESTQSTQSVSGWLTVRRHFKHTTVTGGPVVSASPEDELGEDEALGLGKGGVAPGEKLPGEFVGGSAPPGGSGTSTPTGSGSTPAPTTYSARIAQTYRSMVPRGTKKEPPPKEYFFCVLKGAVLFLYEDETQANCVAAIGIEDYTVEVEGEKGRRFKGRDGEMFAKRNAIALRVARGREGRKGLPVLARGMQAEEEERDKELQNRPIYLFSKSNIKMEDWYTALLRASSQSPEWDEVFAVNDFQSLVDTIDTEPDPIPMRWFNAMIGRIFFGFYKTEAFEQFIIGKIMKKLSKVQRPSFLGPIVVREVNVGSTPPFFSKPMLKDLTADGTAAFEVHMQHRSRASQPNSDVRITIATTATIPTGFKPYVVDLVLAVVLKSFEGNMVVQIKKPPSNRIWYGFTQMPKMEVEIIPVVSERKIQIGMVLKAIEKQIRDVLAESVVLPNMDDLAFFDTSKLDIRGGIFNEAAKLKRDVKGEKEPSPSPPKNTNAELGISNEDPASAVPATASLRKRHGHGKTPSSSLDVPARPSSSASAATAATDDDVSETGITRTETAPVITSGGSGVSGGNAKKAAALQATRKWFAQTGTKPPTLAAQSAMSGFKVPSSDSLLRGRSTSSERRPESIGEGYGERGLEGNTDNRPEVAPVQVSMSTAASTPDPEDSGTGGAPTPVGKVDPREFDTLMAAARPSDASISTTSTSGTTDTAHSGAAPHSSTASLISSLRTRDKKAIQAQVGSAREGLKKWGVSFAAKRRGLKTEDGEHEREEHRSTALYRPPEEEEDPRDDEPLSLSLGSQSSRGQSGRSLQERLSAVAHDTSASPSPLPIPERQRSSSNASRPSLFTSPSKSSSSVSVSPSRWAPASSKPTTGIARNEASVGSPPTAGTPALVVGHGRRHSASQPTVAVQPAPGRGMVVPRVPKRPGEVTGIGSNPAMGHGVGHESKSGSGSGTGSGSGSGHASSGEEGGKKAVRGNGLHEDTGAGVKLPPPLPPRKSLEDRGKDASGGSAEVPLPKAKTALPPLPPRHHSPSPASPANTIPTPPVASGTDTPSSTQVEPPTSVAPSSILSSGYSTPASPPTAPELTRADSLPAVPTQEPAPVPSVRSPAPPSPGDSVSETTAEEVAALPQIRVGTESEATASAGDAGGKSPSSTSGAENALRMVALRDEVAMKTLNKEEPNTIVVQRPEEWGGKDVAEAKVDGGEDV
ncbi:hypothetical protein IAT38_002773 [Cryptococcus sp. DSM 104549]